jgi:hypothetical protein
LVGVKFGGDRFVEYGLELLDFGFEVLEEVGED